MSNEQELWWQEKENGVWNYYRVSREDIPKSIINTQLMLDRTGVLFPVYNSYNSINSFLKEFNKNYNNLMTKLGSSDVVEVDPQSYYLSHMKKMLRKISYELKLFFNSIHRYKTKTSILDPCVIRNVFIKEIIYPECNKLNNTYLNEYLNNLYHNIPSGEQTYSKQLVAINHKLQNNIKAEEFILDGECISLNKEECNFLQTLIQDNYFLANDLMINCDKYIKPIQEHYYHVEQEEFHIPVIIEQLPILIKQISDRIVPTYDLSNGEYSNILYDTEISPKPLEEQISNCVSTIDTYFEPNPLDFGVDYNFNISRYNELTTD